MMNHKQKTKEELISELLEVQQKYQALKDLYEKNIASRKQVDLDLLNSEERLREISKTDWVWEVDEKGIYTYTSQTGIDMFGSSLDDIIGKTAFDFMPPEEKERIAPLFAEIMANKAPIKDLENWNIKKNGELCCILTNGVPILDEKGNLKGYRGVDRDITERKRAEEELTRSENHIRALIDAIPDLIYTLNSKGVYLDYKNAKEGPDQHKDSIIGKNYRDILSPDVADIVGEKIKLTLQTREIQQFEYQRPGQDNGICSCEARMVPSNHEEVLVIVRDVTERKKAEAEIKRMNEELLIANAEKDKFFSIIAHDLRSPFNSFLGLTQIMAENLQDLTMEEIRKFTLTMRDSVSHLYRLLENLLQWSRMQQGMILFNPEIIPLCSIIMESLDIVAEPAQMKEIEITCAIPENLEVLADVNVVQTIIRNLVSNAVKFTPRGGQVNIAARVLPDRFIEVSIEDTGIGMNREMLDKLFRLDGKVNREGTEGEASTGLGLILCKEFIEKQGGKLWVESEEGKGSVFYFTLPYAEESEEQNLGEKVASVAEPAEEAENLKILIAEDDETYELLMSIAVKMFGNEILTARTGAEAVEICRNNPDIDLVMMDVQMPGLDGYEATRQIRTFNKDVIIIALTGFGFTGEREKAIQAGCNDYFSKPVNKYKLKAVRQKYFSK